MTPSLGRVAELADAQDSGSCVRKDVGVQVPPRPRTHAHELVINLGVKMEPKIQQPWSFTEQRGGSASSLMILRVNRSGTMRRSK